MTGGNGSSFYCVQIDFPMGVSESMFFVVEGLEISRHVDVSAFHVHGPMDHACCRDGAQRWGKHIHLQSAEQDY